MNRSLCHVFVVAIQGKRYTGLLQPNEWLPIQADGLEHVRVDKIPPDAMPYLVVQTRRRRGISIQIDRLSYSY